MGLLRIVVQTSFFAVLAIYLFFGLVYLFTGIRIKRVGYLSLRWIQWISRSERVTVEIRKIGLRPQRPTVTRRTWLGIVVSDATITIHGGHAEDEQEEQEYAPQLSLDERVRRVGLLLGKVMQYTVLNWVDLELSSTTVVFEGAGTFQMGMFFLGMNSKPQMFKREMVGCTDEIRKKKPLEITITVRDLYFTIDDKEHTEIVKTIVFTIDLLSGGPYGVCGIKSALRIAGFNIPYDNFLLFIQKIKKTPHPKTPHHRPALALDKINLAFLDIVEELQVLSLGDFLMIASRYPDADISESQWSASCGQTYAY